jgi:hypothetical protein
VLKVSSINYHGGKAGKEQWLLCYQYQGDNPRPKLIARPSVERALYTTSRPIAIKPKMCTGENDD